MIFTLSDEEDEELKEGQKPIEVELNTHFNLSRGKSKLIKRISNISFNEKPEKHELETSEKVCIHPALAIEEDENPEESEKTEHSEILALLILLCYFKIWLKNNFECQEFSTVLNFIKVLCT